MHAMSSYRTIVWVAGAFAVTACSTYAPPPAQPVAAAPAAVPTPPARPATPDATLTMYHASGAIGASQGWGAGDLVFKGKKYRVNITNLPSTGHELPFDPGFGSADFYHLTNLVDVVGTYSTAYPDTDDVNTLRNEHGVLAHVTYASAGVEPRTVENGYRLSFAR